VTKIYNCFQKFNKYVGTAETFYRTGRLLGQGAFGRVILAQHKLTTHFVAIKCLKKSDFQS
jgi:serine/threonine protein kinase